MASKKKVVKGERTGDLGADYVAGFVDIEGLNGKKISRKDLKKLKAIYLYENYV